MRYFENIVSLFVLAGIGFSTPEAAAQPSSPTENPPPKSPETRNRQVHLDFHTSEFLEGIGAKFDKKEFQEALQNGRVNAVNIFAKDWHGWSYYETKYGTRHPHLSFDLMKAQLEACHEIGVKAPIYFAVGHAESEGVRHPAWQLLDRDGKVKNRKSLPPGPAETPRPAGTWTYLAPVNGYLELIKQQTEELCKNYPVDGFWYDVVYTFPVAHNPELLEEMKALKLDSKNDDAVFQYGTRKWQQLMRECRDIIQKYHPDASVFFNGTTFPHGPEKNVSFQNHRFNTQQELEDLPTTSWGWYDKFPLRSKLYHLTGQPIVAMSGKFHIGWGEFGGFKSPAAMRYEAAAMISFGAACNFGDQLHPSGKMDPETYRLIGEAYQYVATIEAYGTGGKPFSTLGVWFSDHLASDEGVANMLLETQIDFVIVDPARTLSAYQVIILPSGTQLTPEQQRKFNAYLEGGGKLLVIGNAALNEQRNGFVLPIGASYLGKANYDVDYTLALEPIARGIVKSPVLNYVPAVRVQPAPGTQVLARIVEPYFSRTYGKFVSHANTPPQLEPADHPAVIRKGDCLFFATPVDEMYHAKGAKVHRDLFVNALNLLHKKPALEVKMPSSARVSLLHQPEQKRFVAHLLYGPPLKRGVVHVIEDLVPLYDIPVKLDVAQKIVAVYAIPGNKKLNFTKTQTGVKVILPKLQMHVGIVFEYQ